MLVTKLSSQFDYGHLKGWKSKIYVTTVLDIFQDRKGINLKMINNYLVIGLYSMKYRSKKKTERKGKTRPLPSRVFLPRPFHFWAQMTLMSEGYQDVIILFFFQPLPWYRFFCSFLAQFYWRYPCLRKWVQGVFNWLYKKPMAAVFLQAYWLPTKILLLPHVTNMISATSV